MIFISSDAAGLVAQVVSVISFAAILTLRRAFTVQRYWEMRALVGAEFLVGAVIVGSMLVTNVTIAAKGGERIDYPGTIEDWVFWQFATPTFLLVVALLLESNGVVLSETAPKGQKSRWLVRELWDAATRGRS